MSHNFNTKLLSHSPIASYQGSSFFARNASAAKSTGSGKGEKVTRLSMPTNIKHKLVLYRDNGNEYRWSLRSIANGRIVADSAEGYSTTGNLVKAVNRLPFDFSVIRVDREYLEKN